MALYTGAQAFERSPDRTAWRREDALRSPSVGMSLAVRLAVVAEANTMSPYTDAIGYNGCVDHIEAEHGLHDDGFRVWPATLQLISEKMWNGGRARLHSQKHEMTHKDKG
jgi:hypothetical protein